jgi:hypothetical protein
MIGFTGTSITITLNYNRLQQITIDDCLRLAPFLPGLRVSYNVTDLVLIYESVTSSASVVHWLTLHSWTLNSLTNESLFTTNDSSTNESRRLLVDGSLLRMNYMSFYNLVRTAERTLPWTVHLCYSVCPLSRESAYQTVVWQWTIPAFRHHVTISFLWDFAGTAFWELS